MENFDVIEPFLDSNGKLKSYPTKYAKKLVALKYIADKIEKDKIYTEKEINRLINSWCLFTDPATLRREMYNHHLLNRTKDCNQYWTESEQ